MKSLITPLNRNDAPIEIPIRGNFLKITTTQDFISGSKHNLEDAPQVGNGALRLAQGQTEGEYLSAIYAVQDFDDLVLSWNSDTPPGTYIEVFARVYLPEYDGWMDSSGRLQDGWSDWITWGKWSPFIRRECPAHQDTHERKGVAQQDGWVFANSFGCGGDSSLNVRGGLTATRLQIMARLSAGRSSARPALRLLAATWKNTSDPAWQQHCTLAEPRVDEKPAVRLDTPAISQMQRDPEYGGVICSATCIAMLLNAQGTDVLPEDITLMNLDYGFGGNGNWSFSVAAAGAYGHESYVHYASFEGLRQELSRGYGVALSVKYSNDPAGSQPYLENAPTTTGGHLITIVGYYYSDELGEYVYYANDPAAKPDEKVAHRQYRQSQLSEAWYRRAIYTVHGRESGAGQWARVKKQGRLLPVWGRQNIYAPVTDSGEHIELPYNFLFDKRRTFGLRGSLAITIEGREKSLPDGVRRVTSNNMFFYDRAHPTDDGYIEISQGFFDKAFTEGKKATLYIVSANGYMYAMTASADNPMYIPGKPAQAAAKAPALGLNMGTIAGAAAGAVTLLATASRLRRRKKGNK